MPSVFIYPVDFKMMQCKYLDGLKGFAITVNARIGRCIKFPITLMAYVGFALDIFYCVGTR